MLKFSNYVRVESTEEALQLLQKNKNNRIVAGGIWMRMASRRVVTAIDLSDCGLDTIEETDDEFVIGAMVSLRQLERHESFNAHTGDVFNHAVRDIVGVQLRNSATVGGSIYGRFGFSDVLCALLPLDAHVELAGAGRVSLAEFRNMGYVRDVIERIVVKKHDYRARYRGVRKHATDFPTLNVTAAYWNDGWHVAVGSRPLPAELLAGEACGLVSAAPAADELRALVERVRALSYGSNLWGSADYRRQVAGALAVRAVCEAAGFEPPSALADELRTVRIPQGAERAFSERHIPGFDAKEAC